MKIKLKTKRFVYDYNHKEWRFHLTSIGFIFKSDQCGDWRITSSPSVDINSIKDLIDLKLKIGKDITLHIFKATDGDEKGIYIIIND